jgi:hypothetical protein
MQQPPTQPKGDKGEVVHKPIEVIVSDRTMDQPEATEQQWEEMQVDIPMEAPEVAQVKEIALESSQQSILPQKDGQPQPQRENTEQNLGKQHRDDSDITKLPDTPDAE